MTTSRQPTFFFLKGHYQQTSVTLMHCKECTRYGCSNTELSDCLASSRCSSVHMQCLYKWRLIMSSAAESLQTAISSPPHSTTPTQNISPSVQVKMTHFQFHWTTRAFFYLLIDFLLLEGIFAGITQNNLKVRGAVLKNTSTTAFTVYDC